MKHGLFMAGAFVILVMAGCSQPVTGHSNGQDDSGSTYTETCWGEWIRMDEDETWYISGEAIKINGEASSKSVSLAKQSDRVIQVTEGGRKYYLYASRIANTSFTGKIAGFGEVAPSVLPSASLSVADGKGWISVVVEDLDNGSTTTTQTDDAGGFTVEGAIPGDEYEITPEGGTPVTVTPQGDGDDVGTITVTEGVNFKTRITEDDGAPYLYANGTQYNFTMAIKNVGTADCLAATYQLSFDEGLVTTASTEKQKWGTIEPGVSKTLNLSLKCGAIEAEYAYKKITITITDEISKKTWEDSVTVKFYKVSTYFYLQTDPSAAAPVYGVVINPYDNKASRFQIGGENLSYVTMPWSSSGYLVVFSGATVETEAAYALGVNGFIPYSDSDFSSFIDMGRYEPNGTEQTAAVLTTDSMMAYLHKNDVDFYRYMVTCPENEPKFEGGSFLVPSSLSLDGSLAWLSENALEGGAYTVILNGDELIAPRTLSYGGKTVSITLLGGMAERTVSLGSSGPLFTVESGVTLKLGYNVTLRGQSNNTSSLVRVDSGGTLEMKSGSKISGNTATVASGGGVSVNGGMFTMSGGEISGNSAHSGGGVYVASGTFIKQSGGVIYGADANSVLKNTANTGYSYGHAVYVSGSQMRDFTVGMGESLDNTQSGAAGGWVEFMPGSLSLDESLVWLSANAVEGGAYTFTVSANESLAPRTLSYGGKTVSITLLGGTEERTVSLSSNGSLFTVGGGVTLKLGNKITLRGLSGNTSSLVRVESGGKLEMNSGSKISGNTSSSYYGGGVYVNGGTFTMSGGEISGNSASLGGGVSVSSGTFTKQSGGIIYGANASSTLKNTATGGYSYGHAVYVSGSQMRNFTVGTGVPLNSTQSGTAGGWAESMPDNLPLNESLAWLSAKATEGGAYTVTVSDSETIGPISLSYGGKTVSITLVGGTAERTVSLGSNGSLFTVGSGVTLKLGNNITLRGRSGNTSALVRVESGGKLEMNSGSKISGNANSSSSASTTGGGVYVAGGTFTMSGGEISGNTAATSGPSSATAYGGGVYVASGTFTMSDGEISGNTASATSYYSGGGGVYVASGSTFTMSGGTINGNKAVSSYHSSGGGVQVDGTFTMSNGTISGNNVSNRGGGVCVTNGTFTMNGGTISSNTATYDGGGVRLESGTFTMKQGAISGNTASSGGGVSVASGTFTKQSGGIIYGSDESSSLKNTASSDSYGHAVYVSSGSKKRNSTAGVGVTMDSMTTGTDGGWE